MKRAMFLLGTAVGFVFGARAGRARYEQIKATAATVAESEAAKKTTELAQQGLDSAVDVLHRVGNRVTETSREIPSRLAHTTESLRQELGEVNERNRQRQAETILTAGDLRDEALDDLSDNDDDAMLDEHGADDRNLSE